MREYTTVAAAVVVGDRRGGLGSLVVKKSAAQNRYTLSVWVQKQVHTKIN